MKRSAKLPELLAPAGSPEALYAAVEAGADAIYLGGRHSARAFAANFDEDELLDGVRYAHLHGVRIYLALNTLLFDRELADILETVGLSGRERDFPSALSGGQQQRVAIARALFQKPSLILADEPTGNLDEKNGEDILALLCKLNAERRITIIIVTHSKAVADRARRLITLRSGRVVSDEVR